MGSRKSTPTPSRPITNHCRAKKFREKENAMGDKGVKLRGQVIDKPKEQMWMLKSDADLEEYKYTCEPGHMEWTPLNSNLTMQGIKVQVNRPIPETTISNLANSHEDTLLLLDLMRHKRQQEGQKKRENMIREVAPLVELQDSRVHNRWNLIPHLLQKYLPDCKYSEFYKQMRIHQQLYNGSRDVSADEVCSISSK